MGTRCWYGLQLLCVLTITALRCPIPAWSRSRKFGYAQREFVTENIDHKLRPYWKNLLQEYLLECSELYVYSDGSYSRNASSASCVFFPQSRSNKPLESIIPKIRESKAKLLQDQIKLQQLQVTYNSKVENFKSAYHSHLHHRLDLPFIESKIGKVERKRLIVLTEKKLLKKEKTLGAYHVSTLQLGALSDNNYLL